MTFGSPKKVRFAVEIFGRFKNENRLGPIFKIVAHKTNDTFFARVFIKVILAVVGGDGAQGHTGVMHPLPQIIGDGAGVFHQPDRVAENIFVDPLQNIFRTSIGGQLQGMVDVAVAKDLTAHRVTFQPEGVCGLFHFQRGSPHSNHFMACCA